MAAIALASLKLDHQPQRGLVPAGERRGGAQGWAEPQRNRLQVQERAGQHAGRAEVIRQATGHRPTQALH